MMPINAMDACPDSLIVPPIRFRDWCYL